MHLSSLLCSSLPAVSGLSYLADKLPAGILSFLLVSSIRCDQNSVFFFPPSGCIFGVLGGITYGNKIVLQKINIEISPVRKIKMFTSCWKLLILFKSQLPGVAGDKCWSFSTGKFLFCFFPVFYFLLPQNKLINKIKCCLTAPDGRPRGRMSNIWIYILLQSINAAQLVCFKIKAPSWQLSSVCNQAGNWWNSLKWWWCLQRSDRAILDLTVRRIRNKTLMFLLGSSQKKQSFLAVVLQSFILVFYSDCRFRS